MKRPDRFFSACLGSVLTSLLFVWGSACGGSPDTPRHSCSEALDAADEVMELHDDVIDLAADAFGHISDFNLDAAERAGAEIDELAPQVKETVARYNRLEEECRG